MHKPITAGVCRQRSLVYQPVQLVITMFSAVLSVCRGLATSRQYKGGRGQARHLAVRSFVHSRLCLIAACRPAPLPPPLASPLCLHSHLAVLSCEVSCQLLSFVGHQKANKAVN